MFEDFLLSLEASFEDLGFGFGVNEELMLESDWYSGPVSAGCGVLGHYFFLFSVMSKVMRRGTGEGFMFPRK